jgi:hypothetical protein
VVAAVFVAVAVGVATTVAADVGVGASAGAAGAIVPWGGAVTTSCRTGVDSLAA